jgi:hypothetical protein
MSVGSRLSTARKMTGGLEVEVPGDLEGDVGDISIPESKDGGEGVDERAESARIVSNRGATSAVS